MLLEFNIIKFKTATEDCHGGTNFLNPLVPGVH